MTTKNKVYMTWEQFDEACHKLVEKLKPFKFKNIYGIPRGGLVVAVKLSHLLDIPLISNIKDSSWNTLVVDDIADTGKTLRPFKTVSCHLCIATLYYHKQSVVVPDHYVHEKKDKWVVFPWEQSVVIPDFYVYGTKGNGLFSHGK